MIKYKIF